MKKLLLNCDLGESFGAYQLGNDKAIIPLVDAVNIACGFHAGDPHVMGKTVRLAKEHHVQIGAHPGFPDLQGFGRRKMQISPKNVYDLIIYQVGALKGFTEANHVHLQHVKPHGALYNQACQDNDLAIAIAQAVYDLDPSLTLVGLSGSALIKAGRAKGLTVENEVFADRTYQDDGSLTPRTLPNAVIDDTDKMLKQMETIIHNGTIRTISGIVRHIEADTVCVHGDSDEALQLIQAIRKLVVK
ncbi:LamB/YcsF family protein [Gracilibacillus caseinilyticus]|uniref:5-oxoprolinase subunit A n=1 Tax=Gracilibacillus caseinilyticus TaxID=2932256 RepID=A0ABY4EWC8_9BACI|nr:5-oxoprolinase subunit PxpA [Gracilibacillus caseinilyticus]UOQ48331.1 LamB/YcsF family protein [Gracilibacillus caseinilyticus]